MESVFSVSCVSTMFTSDYGEVSGAEFSFDWFCCADDSDVGIGFKESISYFFLVWVERFGQFDENDITDGVVGGGELIVEWLGDGGEELFVTGRFFLVLGERSDGFFYS